MNRQGLRQLETFCLSKSRWKRERNLENDVKGLNKQISIATSELERITRSGKNNQEREEQQKISSRTRSQAIIGKPYRFHWGKKAEILRTARRRRQKIQQDRSRNWNRKPNLIVTDLQDKGENTQGQQEETFESIADVEEFWRPMWED